MSSTDETPRPGEERSQDFDFFDSDTDNKPVGKLPSNAKPSSANHSRKGHQEEELHGQGDKRNSLAENQRRDSTGKEELVTKPKKYTSNVRLEMKQTIHKKRETLSVAENKERVTIHVPHERSFQDSESDYDSSSSVTDVSPLQSPDATPRARRKNGESSSKNVDKKKQGKTKFVIKESGTQKNEERPHARRSNGETLSVEDLFYSSDTTPASSGEQDIEAERRKKVLRKKKNRHDEIQHRMEASSRHHRRRLLDVAAQNSMDISQLLEVVLEMEQEEKSRRLYTSNRIPRNTSLAPVRPMSKRNLSFSNEHIRDIDKENERLLKRLTQLCANSQHVRPSSASSVRSVASSVRSSASSNRSSRRLITAMGMRSSPSRGPRLYHSATNRLHDQQRIERDNLAFLKRLQTTRASTSLKRDNLLRDYHRQTGRPVEPIRPRKQKSGYSHREANYDGRPVWQD